MKEGRKFRRWQKCCIYFFPWESWYNSHRCINMWLLGFWYFVFRNIYLAWYSTISYKFMQDETLLVNWKYQLNRDAATLKEKDNLNHIRSVSTKVFLFSNSLIVLFFSQVINKNMYGFEGTAKPVYAYIRCHPICIMSFFRCFSMTNPLN